MEAVRQVSVEIIFRDDKGEPIDYPGDIRLQYYGNTSDMTKGNRLYLLVPAEAPADATIAMSTPTSDLTGNNQPLGPSTTPIEL